MRLALLGAVGTALFAAGVLIGPALHTAPVAEASTGSAIERGKHLVTLSLAPTAIRPDISGARRTTRGFWAVRRRGLRSPASACSTART